jgi:hypothetical protein
MFIFPRSAVTIIMFPFLWHCLTAGVRTLEEADSFGDKVNEFLFEQSMTGPLIRLVPRVEGTW